MPNVALRGMPEQLHRELRSAASRNHRSLNGEILARLTASVRSEPIDHAGLLRRIRQQQAALGPVDVSDETIREMRDVGRP